LKYHEQKIKLLDVRTVDNKGLKQVDSDWAKRLAYGTERTMYALTFEYEKKTNGDVVLKVSYISLSSFFISCSKI